MNQILINLELRYRSLSFNEHLQRGSVAQLRPVVRCLSEDATKTTVQAFIANRLDYCNALFFGITNGFVDCSSYSTLPPGW